MKVKLIAVALCLTLGTAITQAQKPSNSKTQEEKMRLSKKDSFDYQVLFIHPKAKIVIKKIQI